MSGLSLDEVVRMIRGPKGAAVRLSFLRPGQEESQARAVSFVRGELEELSRWGDGVPLQEGVQAPNIQMFSLQGSGEEHLASHSNKIVILEFWATWCVPCQRLLADFQSLAGKYPNWKDRVVVIAASVDEKAEVAGKHVKAKGWGKTHNVWIRQDAIKAYHVNRLPTTYIIDQNGTIVAADYRGEIPEIVNRLLR